MAKLDLQVKIRTALICAIALLTSIYSTTKSQTSSLFDHISSFDTVELFIETNIRELLKKRDKYQPAHVYIKSGDYIPVDTMCEIRSRGNMRKEVCYMPPTKIRFDKKYLRGHQWQEYPTLKIVNVCALNDLSDDYVELEYLIYKIYNLITDRSFKARIVNLHYVDTEGRKKMVEFNGFLLEHEDQLADRIGGEVFSVSYFKSNQLDRKSYLIFTMFQFMIGNTDWKILNKHNLEVIKVDSERTCYPIPYDFDYAGVVKATYAVPHESLPIKNVTERLYLGPCQTEAEVREMCDLFLEKKDLINQLIDQELSSERTRKSCHSYLEDFFRIIENEKNARAIFMNCRDY